MSRRRKSQCHVQPIRKAKDQYPPHEYFNDCGYGINIYFERYKDSRDPVFHGVFADGVNLLKVRNATVAKITVVKIDNTDETYKGIGVAFCSWKEQYPSRQRGYREALKNALENTDKTLNKDMRSMIWMLYNTYNPPPIPMRTVLEDIFDTE